MPGILFLPPDPPSACYLTLLEAYLPVGQLAHAVAPSAETGPAQQLTHISTEVAASADEARPAGLSRHRQLTKQLWAAALATSHSL